MAGFGRSGLPADVLRTTIRGRPTFMVVVRATGIGATRPLVSRLAKICFWGKRCRCGKRAAGLSARCKAAMIRAGFGPRDGPRLAEIEAT